MILIWGLKKTHYKGKKSTTQDVADMRRRSIILLDVLAQSKEPVIAPAIAVSEVLLGVDPRSHGQFIAELQDHFIIQPFDLRAMSLAAQLWQGHRDLPKDQQVKRECLKSDVMIVASAKVAGAGVLYSHDPKLRKLAEKA